MPRASAVSAVVGKGAFTRLELLVAIVAAALVAGFAFPTLSRSRAARGRLPCMVNANGLWKAASSWGLDPANTWREAFPPTNLSVALAADNVDLDTCVFICPEAVRSGVNKQAGIKPAASLSRMTDHNSNYDFVSGYTGKDGDRVLIADKDGQENGAPRSHYIAPDNRFEDDKWGGNHRLISGIPGCGGKWQTDYAAGGNIVKVAGQGTWVATTNQAKDAQYVITNELVRSWFIRGGANTVFGH